MKMRMSERLLRMLEFFHVNMPWQHMPRHFEMIVSRRMNVEIGFDAASLDRVTRSELRTVAGRLDAAGCRTTIHGPFWDLNPGSIDPLIRQVSRCRFQQLFDAAGVFEPLQVVVHTGFDPRHHSGHREAWLANSLASWEPLVERAEKMRIPLLLENVWEHGPDLHRTLLDKIGSPFFGFCLDVGHQHSFSSSPLSSWLESLSGYLREIHLHDNDGRGDSHLPVGRGNIDFESLFEYLGRNKIRPLLTLEPHREEHLAESLAGLEKAAGDYLKDHPAGSGSVAF